MWGVGWGQAQALTKASLMVKCGIKLEACFKEERRERGVGVGMNKKKCESLIEHFVGYAIMSFYNPQLYPPRHTHSHTECPLILHFFSGLCLEALHV